jgi:hypothetical protein
MKMMFLAPSAWIPFVLSLLALLLIVGYAVLFGVENNPSGDEGVPARIFQLLLTIQVPLIAYFGFKWLKKRPNEAVKVLILQITAALIPVVVVLLLER